MKFIHSPVNLGRNIKWLPLIFREFFLSCILIITMVFTSTKQSQKSSFIVSGWRLVLFRDYAWNGNGIQSTLSCCDCKSLLATKPVKVFKDLKKKVFFLNYLDEILPLYNFVQQKYCLISALDSLASSLKQVMTEFWKNIFTRHLL